MNRYFTILFIPEKTSQVKKIRIPAAYLRIAVLLGFLGSFFVAFMIYDYVNVMEQLSENRKLKVENRKLKQKIQIFANKMNSVEDALDRVQTFATKLRIITNQAGEKTEELKEQVKPEIPGLPMDDHSETPGNSSSLSPYYRLKNRQAPLLAEDMLYYFQRASLNKEMDSPKKKALKKKSESLSDLIQKQKDTEVDQSLEKDFQNLNHSFSQVLLKAQNIEENIQSLASTLLDQKDYLESMPSLKPTNGWYTSGFGKRLSPYTGLPTMHEGLDIANHHGSTIRAPAAGIISFANVRPGYGRLITIDHGYGIQTQYGHISKFYVKVGERVKRGRKIAAVGNSGRSTGPHVHYEVRVNGIPVDPTYYILDD